MKDQFDNRFCLEDENEIYKLNKNVISKKYKYEELWGMYFYETDEEAEQVYQELKKIVGDRCE